MKIIRFHSSKESEEIFLPWEDVDFNPTWLGVEAVKNPTDTWLYQEIIHSVRPDFILEAGSYKGGGALFLASMLDLCGIDGAVYSIDIVKRPDMPQHPKISWITGDSADPGIVEMVMRKAEGRRGLVILDSDHPSGNVLHASDHVLKEMRAYWPIVAKNSYLIVEDTWFKSGEGGPHDAVEKFLKENNNFEIDKDMHRYMTTNNPDGFLKRK